MDDFSKVSARSRSLTYPDTSRYAYGLMDDQVYELEAT